MRESKPDQLILKNAQQESRLFNDRVITAWVVALLLCLVLLTRLFFLQVIHHEHFTTLSENNRLKILPLPPTRGVIYDRNGVVLADNQLSYTLEVVPEQVEDLEQTLAELGQIIPISDNDLARFRKQFKQRRPFDGVPLRFQLNEEEVAAFSVKRHRYPGANISVALSRYYPLGEHGVHAIGYVGRINEDELKIIDTSNYSGSSHIGKIGVEKYYETELHGQVGYQHVETNVQGRVLRVMKRIPPVPGKNIYLNLDISLQIYAEQLLAGRRAALVAIQPATGGVLALVSVPSYDPNPFVNGITPDAYAALRNSEDRPLVNRAMRGVYPPGSTIKPFVGLAGLEYGVRQPNQRTWCPGSYSLPNQEHRYRDWKRGGHGSMDLHHAIEQSCDVYFYDLAVDIGIDRLSNFMKQFSFGVRTGIDVPGEMEGLMPTRQWKAKVHRMAWFPGETLISGIGQGYSLATPLQLASATATLSMRGQMRLPRMAFAIDDSDRNKMQLIPSLPPRMVTLRQDSFWDNALAAMEAVVHGPSGTAGRISQGLKYHVAGKTGTAQVVGIKQDEKYDASKLDEEFHDHAWFIAFAPVENPQIAVAVLVENGGSGSKTAAPIARQILDHYILNSLPAGSNGNS
jgi:penicillin-binding protein 2